MGQEHSSKLDWTFLDWTGLDWTGLDLDFEFQSSLVARKGSQSPAKVRSHSPVKVRQDAPVKFNFTWNCDKVFIFEWTASSTKETPKCVFTNAYVKYIYTCENCAKIQR